MADETLEEKLTEENEQDMDITDAASGTADGQKEDISYDENNGEFFDGTDYPEPESINESSSVEGSDADVSEGSGVNGEAVDNADTGEEPPMEEDEELDEVGKKIKLSEMLKSKKSEGLAKDKSAEDEETERIDKMIEERNALALKNSKVPHNIGTKKYFDGLERAVNKKQKASDEAEYVKLITADYDWNINIGETVFLNSGSANFNKQFEKAANNYVMMENGEFPILLYDKTVRMNAKQGFTLTNLYLYVNQAHFPMFKIKISKINTIIVSFGETVDDWSDIKIKRKNSKLLYPVFKSLNAERVAEVSEFILKMCYHLWPKASAKIVFKGSIPEEEEVEDDDESKVMRKFRSMFSMGGPRRDKRAQIWTPEYERKRRGIPDGEVKAGEKKGKDGEAGDNAEDAGKKDKKAAKKGKDSKEDSSKKDNKKSKKKKK